MGLAWMNCEKAVRDLEKVAERARVHIVQNVENWPPDRGHVREKGQILTEFSKAYAKVVKHCACWIAESALKEMKQLLDTLENQMNAFRQAMSDGRFLIALMYLLAALAVLLALMALIAASIGGAAAIA